MRMARRGDLVQELEQDARFALRQTPEQRAFHRGGDRVRLADESFAFPRKAQQRGAAILVVAHSGQQSLCGQFVERHCQIRHREAEEPGQLPVRRVVVRVDENQNRVIDSP